LALNLKERGGCEPVEAEGEKSMTMGEKDYSFCKINSLRKEKVLAMKEKEEKGGRGGTVSAVL